MSIANAGGFEAPRDRDGRDGRSDPRIGALPILLGDTVRLREIGTCDRDALAQLLADPRVTEYQFRPPPRTGAEIDGWIRLMHRRRTENAVLCFGVVPRAGDTLIGIGQLSLAAKAAGVEWGWLLDPSAWGSGAFADLTSVLRRYARAHYGAHELLARVHVDNRRAACALQKIGSVLRSVVGATMTWTTTTLVPAGDEIRAVSELRTRPSR